MLKKILNKLKVLSHAANAEDGFSLIELMVVVVIMGLLTTVVVINVMPNRDRAMVEKAKADISTIAQAVEMYRMDQMKYPSMEQGIEILSKAPEGSNFRNQGYIKMKFK
ncbi:MAG TPA: type II secretion system major pseudopilin GspG [Emcibacteraceae bacterium]|nr:type II secretion system major pseudopilin GspG [Emcibacteraceae bacterium]